MNELIFNMAKCESLDEGQQTLIEESCKAVNPTSIMSDLSAISAAIAEFESVGVEICSFPEEVLVSLTAAFEEVIAEQAAEDETFKRVGDSLKAYREKNAA